MKYKLKIKDAQNKILYSTENVEWERAQEAYDTLRARCPEFKIDVLAVEERTTKMTAEFERRWLRSQRPTDAH